MPHIVPIHHVRTTASVAHQAFVTHFKSSSYSHTTVQGVHRLSSIVKEFIPEEIEFWRLVFKRRQHELNKKIT